MSDTPVQIPLIQTLAGAEFSDCRTYRYALWRIWDESKPLVMFVGLNPSTANETSDDPTIRKVMKIAAFNGFGGVYMMNLFAWVTPYPEELIKCADPISENDKWLENTLIKCKEIIFAWGNFEEARYRVFPTCLMNIQAKCLHINKSGTPKHPLYCKDQSPFISYKKNML